MWVEWPLVLGVSLATLLGTEVLVRASGTTRRVAPLVSVLLSITFMFVVAVVVEHHSLAEVVVWGALAGIIASYVHDVLTALMGDE